MKKINKKIESTCQKIAKQSETAPKSFHFYFLFCNFFQTCCCQRLSPLFKPVEEEKQSENNDSGITRNTKVVPITNEED